MEQPVKITVFGRDHELKGEICVRAPVFPNIALGTSTGVTSKLNEDSLGVSILGREMVLAIADGHWGREASEIAISKAIELLGPETRPSRESEIRARLFSLFEQVNDQLYELGTATPGASTPETTLIVCHVKQGESGEYVYWASFGDSYLFLLRKGQLKQLNSLNARWLGYLSKLSETAETRSILMSFLFEQARYVGVASGLETGIEMLEYGDILLLCTDGLIGSDREPAPSVLAGIQEMLTSDLHVGSRVEKLIASALKRGEQDNVSCLVALIR